MNLRTHPDSDLNPAGSDSFADQQTHAAEPIQSAHQRGRKMLFTADASVLLLMASLGLLGFGLGGNGTILMKVALSDLSGQSSGAATGTYGLFRDLAAPFGVAVLVPMFTNSITGYVSQGMAETEAAVRAVRTLSVIEIICVAAGIAVVLMLPRIHHERRQHHAAE